MMSSYNRIPRDSVSFSNESVLFEVELEDFKTERVTQEEAVIPKKTEQELKEDMLLEKEMQLLEREKELMLVEQAIKQEYEQLNSEKENFDSEIKKQKDEHERQKRKDYYIMREFMWDQSIQMAEEIVHQSIDVKQLSLKNVFDGLIEKLPISLDELEVTVHPFTLEYINSEESKEAWTLNDIKWKLNYSLEIGDFVLEVENEYYDNRLSHLFAEIKKRIEKKYLESGEGGFP